MMKTSWCKFIAAVMVVIFPGLAAQGDEWPQWRGPNRDGVWSETGIVETFESDSLPLRWRAPISSGYSSPTIAGGRVFVTDRVDEPKQVERVHCFEWQTGKPVWSYSYDCPYRNISYTGGPRAAVTVDDGRAYSLGTMGHFHCFDAANGTILWRKDLKTEYSIRMPQWGIAGAPIVEGDLVIVAISGEPDACIVAFDKRTGEPRWQALADPVSYSAPIVIDQAGRRVLVCWTGARIVGLDPKSGELLWAHVYPPVRWIRSVATPVVHGDQLFLSGFFGGSLMLKLASDRPAVEKVWLRRGENELNTDGLHTNISTCYLDGKYIYGVDAYGALRCLDARTGDRVWESLAATPPRRWSNIHFVRNADKVWLFNEKGELIISQLSSAGFKEISRASLIRPTKIQLPSRREGVCWTHPAFAYRHVFVRNDEELVCADLTAR